MKSKKKRSASSLQTGLPIEFFDENQFVVFKKKFIDENRGFTLNLIRCEEIKGLALDEFIQRVIKYIEEIQRNADDFGKFYIFTTTTTATPTVFIGLVSYPQIDVSNIDSLIGRIHKIMEASGLHRFHYGIGRTPGNHISDIEEIYETLADVSQKNLEENVRRWGWTKLNNIQRYFSKVDPAAVIQPIIQFKPEQQVYEVVGGEVFVGGSIYEGYHKLFADVPHHQDLKRIELLIVEKLILECQNSPGLLKFNISPQSLLDSFNNADKVKRFYELLLRAGLNPKMTRIELIEQPYQEYGKSLKEVCELFWQYGISFAADDFGVKSQSHQVILDLGQMIKEFKLDPMSFKFKQDEDHTKFLDNLAFIDYCKRLADNRDATITAEAVIDYDSLQFLKAHKIYFFQTNLFCPKISLEEYKEIFYNTPRLSEETVHSILSSSRLTDQLHKSGHIFALTKKLKIG